MNVTLLNATPDPETTVCKAARNDYTATGVTDPSFEELMAGVDGETIEEKKRTLIEKMLSRGHFGPLEHVNATFSIEGVSRALMAQLTRHRHATFDIQSMRYVKFDEMEPGEAVVEIPELEDPGTPGRNGEFDISTEEYTDEQILNYRQGLYTQAIENAFHCYDLLLTMGVAPEHARMVLPIGTKVNIVCTLNLRMILHVADMRAAGDAQGEIQEMTEQLLDEAAEWAPITMTYYNENMKGRKNRLSP